MRKLRFLLAVPCLLVLASFCQAQSFVIDLPAPSQHAVITQRLGLTDITINYHRPLVNGRVIWGKLVPYGEVWRAGANENTTIAFTDPVSIDGKPLPAGTYGLHMIPGEHEWTVIFSKQNAAWGSFTYKQDEDALRITVKPAANLNRLEEVKTYRGELDSSGGGVSGQRGFIQELKSPHVTALRAAPVDNPSAVAASAAAQRR